jgi:hypothetical protein
MKCQRISSSIISCCITAVILLSLWVNAAQGLCVQHVQDNGDIVLDLDADSHANDSLEQVALITRTLGATFVSHNAFYQLDLAPTVPPSYFRPLDRPPEFA